MNDLSVSEFFSVDECVPEEFQDSLPESSTEELFGDFIDDKTYVSCSGIYEDIHDY